MSITDVMMIAPLLLFSLTIHEYAHARTALHFGDPTARNMGRVTLNPLAHLDLMGTIAILLIGFGWAKPVPVNPANLYPRKIGDIAVSLAGPASNLMLAVICGIMIRISTYVFTGDSATIIAIKDTLVLCTIINCALAIFNLIPLFPLDGHHIMRELLPAHKQYSFMMFQVKYGQIILLALIFVPRLAGDNFPNPLGYAIGSILIPLVSQIIGRY